MVTLGLKLSQILESQSRRLRWAISGPSWPSCLNKSPFQKHWSYVWLWRKFCAFFLSFFCQREEWICLLTHYQTTNFRFFQTERVCRRHFQIWWKWQKVNQMGRKHCGKRRNCLLRAISPFPTGFFKGLFSRGVKGVIVWEWVTLIPHTSSLVHSAEIM